MSQTVISLEHVHKSFGNKVVLDDVNLEVYEHETLVILGENGSGKSICLKTMIGLVQPDAGSIKFRGQEITEMEHEQLRAIRQHVSYVFQSDALFDSMTIADNVGYGLREHTKASDDEIRARALECLTMVALSERVLDVMPATLSGGMKKRASLARAIATRPEVVLYDEPTGGLDPQNVTRIGKMIRKLQEELHITSVVVTHDMEVAFDIADRIALLHEGRFSTVATPEEFRRIRDPAVLEFTRAAAVFTAGR